MAWDRAEFRQLLRPELGSAKDILQIGELRDFRLRSEAAHEMPGRPDQAEPLHAQNRPAPRRAQMPLLGAIGIPVATAARPPFGQRQFHPAPARYPADDLDAFAAFSRRGEDNDLVIELRLRSGRYLVEEVTLKA